MALNRTFGLYAFNDTSYDHASYGFENLTDTDLILFCSEYDTDTDIETPFSPISLVSFPDGIQDDVYYCGYSFPDGSLVSIGFSGVNTSTIDERLTFNFNYDSPIVGNSSFFITGDAYKLLHSKMGYNTSVVTQTPSSGVLFESLNGADGSYADGTPVTVVGRDGAFKFLASRNFYNDSKDSQNMLIYFLERTHLKHKPTMLVADIYVKKVVTQ